ncbi:MAG: 3'-5' exonuclease [Desulfuromonas sp.]|nr:3'-5' exonuclease [Desulfuromonas sp.]
MNHLAIDLETLSLEPNAHILSIGAVFFDPATGEMGDSFYVEIDPQHDQPNAHVSASTAAWWATQPAGVFPCRGEVMIGDALRQFIEWVGANERLRIYQQGDRDAMWLTNAAREQRLVMPWSYRDVFCARTLWKHSFVGADFVEYAGVVHNALDDARFVATRMLEVVR